LAQPVGEARSRSTLALAVLSVAPLLLLSVGLYLKATRGPYWLGLNSDPEYAYLFNSLLILSGKPPFLIEHPGIPVETLGAVVVRAVYGVSGSGSLIDDVVGRPELYLSAIHFCLISVTALLVFSAGVIVLKYTKQLSLAILVQLAPWLSVNLLEELSRVRPEPLLIGMAVLFGALIFLTTSEGKSLHDHRSVLVFGAVVGIAVATKMTALPLLLGPLVVFDEWRPRLLFLGASAVGFLAAILPALPKVLSMGKWSATLLIHSGDYGSGPASIIEPVRYLPALWSLVAGEPVVAAIMMCSAVMWLVFRESRALGAALVVQIAQLLMVAKHPAPHYLVPAIGTLGVNLCVCWQYWASRAGQRFRAPAPAVLLLAGLLVFQGLGLRSRSVALQAARIDQETIARETEEAGRKSECVTIYYYRSSSRAYALQFGNLWSKSAGLNAAPALVARYPNVLFDKGGLHIRDFAWQDETDLRALVREHACVLLEGTTLTSTAVAPEIALDVTFAAMYETLYRLRGPR
jgi:hypothetical protein